MTGDVLLCSNQDKSIEFFEKQFFFFFINSVDIRKMYKYATMNLDYVSLNSVIEYSF